MLAAGRSTRRMRVRCATSAPQPASRCSSSGGAADTANNVGTHWTVKNGNNWAAVHPTRLAGNFLFFPNPAICAPVARGDRGGGFSFRKLSAEHASLHSATELPSSDCSSRGDNYSTFFIGPAENAPRLFSCRKHECSTGTQRRQRQ